MLSVLRNRNFAKIYLAGVASVGGFSIGQIALIVLVYNNTNHSPLPVAYLGLSFSAASVIFSLAAGVMVDRFERRRLMVLSDIVRAGSLVALAATIILVGFSLVAVLAVAFIIGSFTTLFQPAERAFTPEIVGTEQLIDANAIVQTSSSVIQGTGAAIGGILVAAVGIVAALALNSATFLISALFIVGIVGYTGHIRQGTGGNPRPSALDDIKEGFRYIVNFRTLLYLTLSAGASNFFFSMAFQFTVVYTDKMLNGGALLFGVLLSLFSLGWGPGAYLAAHYNAVRFAGKVWIYSGVAEGGCVLLLVLFPQLAIALASMFMLGVLLGLTNTTWLTIVQLIVPTEMQGRYFGLDQLGSFAVIPVGQILGGVIVATSGVGFDYTLAALGVMVSSGLFAFSSLKSLKWEKPGTEAQSSSSAKP
jgi:MFS family permease